MPVEVVASEVEAVGGVLVVGCDEEVVGSGAEVVGISEAVVDGAEVVALPLSPFKLRFIAVNNGFFPEPQIPRKSSVSMDHTITPPNCLSRAYFAFKLILSESS